MILWLVATRLAHVPMLCGLQVFVMNQHWGDAYFHFVVENLARITFMLDILRAHTDIKVTLRFQNASSRIVSTPFPSGKPSVAVFYMQC